MSQQPPEPAARVDQDSRKRLWQRVPAEGSILEIGVGTGVNLPYYPPSAKVTAVDISGREFAIAYDEGKLIGVLCGTGGIADEVEMLERIVQKETGGHIIYGTEAAPLLDELLGYYRDVHSVCLSCFG